MLETELQPTQVTEAAVAPESYIPSQILEALKVEHLDDAAVQALVAELSKDPQMGEAFESDTGVWEKYTLKTHTRMIFNIFERYFAPSMSPELRQTMRLFLLLHDIGKPLAIKETGSKEAQHEYTLRMMESILPGFHLQPDEMELMKALTDQDILGDYMKSLQDIEVSQTQVVAIAERIHQTPGETLALIKKFFLTDASSYTRVAGEGLDDIDAQPSLEFLFDFQPEARKMDFSPKLSPKFPEKSPLAHYQELEARVIQLTA